MSEHLSKLITRFPKLEQQRDNIEKVFKVFKTVFENDGTLFICGNGGSAADAEHIVGELMKSFKLKRPISDELKNTLITEFGEEGTFIAERLQAGMKSIALTNHSSLSTAFANDVDGSLIFAQQLSVLGAGKDALLALSTSGNSDNVVKCMKVAKAMGMKTVCMTGADSGQCGKLADITVKSPDKETFIAQEYHLPIYHTLCLMLEEYFYG